MLVEVKLRENHPQCSLPSHHLKVGEVDPHCRGPLWYREKTIKLWPWTDLAS